ncbi:hypothetical protein NM688_g8296 [Phlebia brevispora]|uniref:Uncharacterized protein n=1 Tax=Phlebia brevispora TaxID=194682 RepID=A0ACC1RU04_9APHY|nr:hypothetical protein NM688_g8296 [Phlebia brevispora]
MQTFPASNSSRRSDAFYGNPCRLRTIASSRGAPHDPPNNRRSAHPALQSAMHVLRRIVELRCSLQSNVSVSSYKAPQPLPHAGNYRHRRVPVRPPRAYRAKGCPHSSVPRVLVPSTPAAQSDTI